MSDKIITYNPTTGENILKDFLTYLNTLVEAGENISIGIIGGKLIISAGGGGLPAGTVNNSTLRWGGADWIESTSLLFNDNRNGNFTKSLSVINQSGSEVAFIEVGNPAEIGGSYAHFRLASANPAVLIQPSSYTAAFVAISVVVNNGGWKTSFSVLQNGRIKSDILTANTVLLANPNKEIVSLANAEGFLKNDGSGGMTWESAGGGGNNDKVAISSSDTTPDYLFLKLVGGTGISLNVLTPAGNEQLEINGFSGDYDDLTNKPTIPDAQIQSDWNQSDAGEVDYIKNKPSIPADINELTDNSNLLFSGDYDDLSNKPTIPTDISELTDNTNLLFSGDYLDLTNKPIIPVNQAVALATEQLYPNLFVTTDPPPLPEAITVFRKIGDLSNDGNTNFKFTVEAGKKYKFNCKIILDGASDDVPFQLRVNGDGAWNNWLTLEVKRNGTTTYFRNDTTSYDYNNRVLKEIQLNQIIDFIYENDNDSLTYAEIDINGLIETATETGEITIDIRNTQLTSADNTAFLGLRKTTNMSIIEYI